MQADAEGAVVRGRDRGRHLGRRARRVPVLVQHPGALVPQVLRREGRPRHEPAGHLGPDHRRRGRQRRHGRRPGQQVRGLRRLDQRADLRRRRQHHRGRRRRAPTPRSTSTARPATTRPASSRSWPTPRPRPPTCRCPTRAPAGSTFGSPPGRRSWSTGPTSSTTTTRPQPDVAKDIGYATYPETVAGKPSRPPYGGIGIGVSKYSDHIGLRARGGRSAWSSPENQGVNAELTGNMPASPAGYEYPAAAEALPAGPARSCSRTASTPRHRGR